MNAHPFSREAAEQAGVSFRDSIFSRAFLWCLVAALAPALLVIITGHFYFEHVLGRVAQTRLNLVGEQKLRSLNLFFANCERDAVVLSRTPVVVRGATELSAIAQQRAGFSSERYRAASQTPFEHLRTVVTTSGYADALLVSAAGEVLLATTARPELGTNLRTGRYRDTELTRTIDAARATLRPAFSSFRIYPPSGRAVVWMVAPVLQGRALAGYVVLEVSRDAFNAVARDYAGLGATGEILLGEVRGKQLLMLTPTRDNRLAAFQALPSDGAKSSALALASEGRSGSGRTTDLRGIPSIAWWSYVPQIKCGLVVRMNASEAFGAVNNLRTLTLWTAVASILFALVAAWLVARSIARPLQELERGVRRVAGGDWAHRIGQEGQGEIPRIGRAFDQMIEKVQAATAAHNELGREIEQRKATESEVRLLSAELERRLRERTAELEQRSQQFADESTRHSQTRRALAEQFALMSSVINSLPHPMFIMDDQARFMACNSAYEHAFGVTDAELKGRTVLDVDILPEEERMRFHDENLAVIRDDDQRSYELTIPFADGEEHPALYSVNGFRRDDGTPGGLIGVMIDITDHKRAERELEVVRQSAEKATREKSDLAARFEATKAKLTASIGAAEEASRQAVREREEMAARLMQTEERLKEAIRAADEAAARKAMTEETVVVSREEFAELPPRVDSDEPEAQASDSAGLGFENEARPVEDLRSTEVVEAGTESRDAAVESESESAPPEPASDRHGVSHRASPSQEIAPPTHEQSSGELPQAEPGVIEPADVGDARAAEIASPLPEVKEQKSAEPPSSEDPPAKPATKKPARSRKSATPSSQQELFAADSAPVEATSIPARNEVPESTPPPRAEAEVFGGIATRTDKSVRATPVAETVPEEFSALEGVDAAEGLRRAGGNRKTYRNLLLKFRDNHGQAAEEIQSAVESGNHELAKRLTHGLKGAAFNLGADEVCEAAKALEAVMRGHAQDEDDALLPRLEAALRRVISSIDGLEPRRKAPPPPAPAALPVKPREAPALRSVDVKSLRLSLWTLESLLRNGDPDAKAELAALRPQVKDTAFEARFDALAREIAGERFESAVAELERIKADLVG